MVKENITNDNERDLSYTFWKEYIGMYDLDRDKHIKPIIQNFIHTTELLIELKKEGNKDELVKYVVTTFLKVYFDDLINTMEMMKYENDRNL